MVYKKPLADSLLLNLGSAQNECLAPVIRVGVWNLQKCGKKCGADFKEFAAATDLFFTQELKLNPETEAFLKNTGLHWTVAISYLSLFKNYPTGIAIGSAAKPIKSEARNDITEPLLKVPKMISASLIPLEDGRELLAINVHAINFKGIKHFKEYLKKAETFFTAFKGPLIIAGDFNTWSRLRILSAKLLARKLGLREVKFNPDLRTKFFGKKVDFIFYRGLKLKKAFAARVKSSDHNPLFAEFELKN